MRRVKTLQISKIAVIGASGFLGSYLFRSLSKCGTVVGTYFSRQNKDLYFLDIRDKNMVKQFFKKFQPNLVIVCGGMTKPDDCELNRKLAYDINVRGMENVTRYCNSKLIYFSTDYVFDGKKGFYSEEDTPNPINHYGRTKLKAEEIVLKNSDNVVIRVSGLYGYNEKNNEFLKSFNSSMVYRANDLLGSTLVIDDVVRYLPFFIRCQGIYHLSSESAISRYEFALMVVRILGLPTKVIGKQYKKIYSVAERPQDTSLISVKHKLKICKEKEGLNLVKKYLTYE